MASTNIDLMRLLMLNNEFPPLGGGTGVVNRQILIEFARQPEVWVDLVTSSRGRQQIEMRQFSERIRIFAAPVDNRNLHHATNPELMRYAWGSYRLSRELIRAAPYDASFAFAGVPAGAVSWALKRATHLPYLVALHGADVPGFEARYAYLYPVLRPVVRRIWQEAAVVTTISAAHARLAQATWPSLPITVIPNGVDTDAFRLPDRPRVPGRRLNILCVGRLIERKGQHHLLRAFAQLRATCAVPMRLTLVGAGDAEAGLRRQAAELNLGADVTFAGAVAHADMPGAYQQADIFVLPSQNEGMSVAILEAMASGLPVIVTPTGGALGMVSDGVQGRSVPWADVPALRAALGQLAGDHAGRQRMGEAARRAALHYTWSAIAHQYLEACGRAAAQANGLADGAPVGAGALVPAALPSAAPE